VPDELQGYDFTVTPDFLGWLQLNKPCLHAAFLKADPPVTTVHYERTQHGPRAKLYVPDHVVQQFYESFHLELDHQIGDPDRAKGTVFIIDGRPEDLRPAKDPDWAAEMVKDADANPEKYAAPPTEPHILCVALPDKLTRESFVDIGPKAFAAQFGCESTQVYATPAAVRVLTEFCRDEIGCFEPKEDIRQEFTLLGLHWTVTTPLGISKPILWFADGKVTAVALAAAAGQ
jgi:hypothetical protein